MRKIILSFFLTSFFVLSLYSADNYSEMSTQELISIIGYIKKSDVDKFKKELELRVPKMSADEKKMYQENLNKIK